MDFLPRQLGQSLQQSAAYFKVILLLGARQTGKRTLLRHLFPEIHTIVFDPVQDLYAARKDPDRFLDLFPAPLILDEVQFVPELLAAIKRRVDQSDAMGQYFLTGSQNFSVLKGIAESMAGRVAIFHLDPMTAQETRGLGAQPRWLDAYLKQPAHFFAAPHTNIVQLPSLAEFLFRGTYPRAIQLPLEALSPFFLGYLQTYVERDVRMLEQISDLHRFGDFLGLAAALTAQEINPTQLGRELGVSPPTARKWLDLLVHSYQWVELRPYHGNAIKRLSERRKGYFKDVGLATHLLKISSPEALVTSGKLGALFETWVVNSILTMGAVGTPPGYYHWRTHAGAEVDLILERDGALFPIEVKCKSHPTRADASGIRAFRQSYPDKQIMPGLIIHAGEETYPIDEETWAISWKLLH